MEISQLATTRNFAEAYIRTKTEDTKNYVVLTSPIKPLNQTPEERATALKQMSEMDKHAAESRTFIKKQYGTDPMVQNKVERKPMTEEEQATYVQAWMDRFTEGDTKFQQLVQMTRQWETGGLTQTAQGSLVDISA